MCLIDRKQFRVTEKRIPIYKVVQDEKYSPYQGTELHRINNPLSGNCRLDTYNPFTQYIFEYGFYHACLDKECAIRLITTLIEYDLHYGRTEGNYKVVTGYIPENTRYAIDHMGNICAKRMILNL